MPSPQEEDLLAELAGQLLREERARRAAEERIRTLEEDLARADAMRDRAVDELRGQVEALRRDLLDSEQQRARLLVSVPPPADPKATVPRPGRSDLERQLAEAQAEIAQLRARRSPSVRAMAALRQSQPPPPAVPADIADELAKVQRTADEAITALKDLLQRKEAVLAEGRAILEKLSPTTRAAIEAPRIPRPSAYPTPVEGVPIQSEWPELIFDEDDKTK